MLQASQTFATTLKLQIPITGQDSTTGKQHTVGVNFFQFLPFVSFLQDTCSWVIDVDTITGELC